MFLRFIGFSRFCDFNLRAREVGRCSFLYFGEVGNGGWRDLMFVMVDEIINIDF